MATKRTSKPTTDEVENKTTETTQEAEKVTSTATTDEVVDGEVIGGETEETVEEAPIQTSGETVTVCSNYPRDLKFMVPDNSGRQVAIVIKGNATNLRGKEKGIIPIGGYGVTTGVPKDTWEWILKHRPDDEFIKKGLVFATTAAKARAAAKERAELRHGFEPADTKKANSRPYNG